MVDVGCGEGWWARTFEAHGCDVVGVDGEYVEQYHRDEGLGSRFCAADLSRPIILDEDGELMDGRHRLMKAMLLGEESVLAVRFDENPSPCRVSE